MSYQLYRTYNGILAPADPRMPKYAKKAYDIWSQQKQRNTVEYTSRQFIAWWRFHVVRKKWKDPTCGRIDHSKGYSFDNIEMQERSDNIKERNVRCGNPGKTAKPVVAIIHGTQRKFFSSKEAAARHYSVSIRTIFNHCSGRTKNPFKFGPKSPFAWGVRFEWA